MVNKQRRQFDFLLGILILLQLLSTPVSSTSTACYRANGVLGDSDIQPCHANQALNQHSACCNLGKSPPDLCLAGGLCYRQDGYDGNFLIYAVGCTDATGTDPACQQYCPVGEGTAMYSLNACFDGTWCCNNLTFSESCCDKTTGKGVFTMRNLLSLDPTPSVTSTVTLATGGSGITTITSTSTVVNTLPSSCSNDHGVLIGASVGAAAGGFLIALLTFCAFTRRSGSFSKQRESFNSTVEPVSSTEHQFGSRHEIYTKPQTTIGSGKPNTYISELPHETIMHEISGNSPAEMKAL